MATEMWIDNTDSTRRPGEIGFLVERFNASTKARRVNLYSRPAHHFPSNTPVLEGFAGHGGHESITARGVWEIVSLNPNGRMYVRKFDLSELPLALNKLGYPELIPVDLLPKEVD